MVRLEDDSGIGLFTLTFSATVLGVPLPTIIASDGKLLSMVWDGTALWNI